MRQKGEESTQCTRPSLLDNTCNLLLHPELSYLKCRREARIICSVCTDRVYKWLGVPWEAG